MRSQIWPLIFKFDVCLRSEFKRHVQLRPSTIIYNSTTHSTFIHSRYNTRQLLACQAKIHRNLKAAASNSAIKSCPASCNVSKRGEAGDPLLEGDGQVQTAETALTGQGHLSAYTHVQLGLQWGVARPDIGSASLGSGQALAGCVGLGSGCGVVERQDGGHGTQQAALKGLSTLGDMTKVDLRY